MSSDDINDVRFFFASVLDDLRTLYKAAGGDIKTVASMVDCETKAMSSWLYGFLFPSLKSLSKIDDAMSFISSEPDHKLIVSYQAYCSCFLDRTLKGALGDHKRLSRMLGFSDDDTVSYWLKGEAQPSYDSICRMQAFAYIRGMYEDYIEDIAELEKETNKRLPIAERAHRVALYSKISKHVLSAADDFKRVMSMGVLEWQTAWGEVIREI